MTNATVVPVGGESDDGRTAVHRAALRQIRWTARGGGGVARWTPCADGLARRDGAAPCPASRRRGGPGSLDALAAMATGVAGLLVVRFQVAAAGSWLDPTRLGLVAAAVVFAGIAWTRPAGRT